MNSNILNQITILIKIVKYKHIEKEDKIVDKNKYNAGTKKKFPQLKVLDYSQRIDDENQLHLKLTFFFFYNKNLLKKLKLNI